MLAEYTGAVVILAIATILACALLGIHLLVGPRRSFAEKDEPFECGERPIVSPHQRFSVKFYIVAMLFILFDVEVIFLYPVAVHLKASGAFVLGEILVFVALLTVAFIFVWRRGALEWK
jgi:NADH-quinone oxidoreductase subunit A